MRRYMGLRRLSLALWMVLLPAAQPLADAQMDDQAFQAAQWALSTTTGQALAQLGPRLAASDDAIGALVRDYQDALEGWRQTTEQLRDALAVAGNGGATGLRARQRTLQQRVDRLQSELDLRFPLYRELTDPHPLAISEVQTLLRPGEGLLVTLVGGGSTDLWLVTPEGAQWQRATVGRSQLSDWVRRLRNDLLPVDGEAPERFNRTIAYQLHQALLAPFGASLEVIDHLLYIPDGPLTSLPLVLLVVAPPEGANDDLDALRQSDWLLRHMAVSQLPTVSNLRTLRGLRAAHSGEQPFRGYGAPQFNGRTQGDAQRRGDVTLRSLYRGGRSDLKALHNLAPLPQSQGELESLAEALKATKASVITGLAATEHEVRSADLSNTRVLAFATHALVAGELDGVVEPALVLSPPERASEQDDGLLSASEAARLRLNADWVVLSACNTAAPDGTPGAEGLSGLARAFLYAGARAVLASHWPVRDDAAAQLTSGTFLALAEEPGLTRAEALRRSMLSLLGSSSDPSLAHPEAWAPFVLIGEGGR